MKQFLHAEEWREVSFDFEYTSKTTFEISNTGKLRSHSITYGTRILNGTLINGYHAIHFKFFKPRDPKTQHRFDYMRHQISKLYEKIKPLKASVRTRANKDALYHKMIHEINSTEELIAQMKKNHQAELKADDKKRAMHPSFLIHRLVAEKFVKPASPKHLFVAHIDHVKTNNHFTNLVWMTQEELSKHQQKSPASIRENKLRKHRPIIEGKGNYKLDSTKVMLIKKRIIEGTPLSVLAKSFKVTETQLLRIKTGENWGHVKPAK